MNFQDMILALHAYWAEYGCVIRQGYDMEVGAGTFNPATFLMALGPEPYDTAYVEPCRRPTDGRYGENPNRMQHYYQFQVILKPSPENIQELYLTSLEAIGIRLEEHDIRFVHDDWESPTLGAWGLGWEVWLDGMEITQFTYFQQVGGIPLQPVTGEITYGLERIAMYIQKKDSVFQLAWNNKISYGDVHHRNEVEFSGYNFKHAGDEMWFRHFRDYEQEARACLEQNLTLPAYDMVMKASHAFNMLDARGVISVTERMGYILRIRELASLVARAYVGLRESMGFPLLEDAEIASKPDTDTCLSAPVWNGLLDTREEFVLEIGSEELPAAFLPAAMENLKKAFVKLLESHDIGCQSVRVTGTPRRLAVLVSGLETGKPETRETRKGPPLANLYDEQGNPTKMAQGYTRNLGAPLPSRDDLLAAGEDAPYFVRDIKGKQFIHANVVKAVVATASILARNLPDLILGLPFPKKMRWSDHVIEYARPIRWLLCMLGSDIIPFNVGHLKSGDSSQGHPLLAKGWCRIPHASDYLEVLREKAVIADQDERRAMIVEQLDKICAKRRARPEARDKVLKQVLYLVEYPQLAATEFSREFLDAPKEVLISEMVEHQKYFALAREDGSLTNTFVITANTQPSEYVLEGNRKVLAARLSDGRFMYQQDLQVSPRDRNAKLENITFQEGLGSMGDKVRRLVRYADRLDVYIPCDEENVRATAELCKSDLASLVVYDFPELQGIMGKYYALHHGENKKVAAGIEEHYKPLGRDDSLPGLATGVIVALADKMDNLLACFGSGKIPGATSDPFGLRRQVLGILRILIEKQINMPIWDLFREFYAAFDGALSRSVDETLQDLTDFFTKRIETVFTQYALRYDEIAASVATPYDDVYNLYRKIVALKKFRDEQAFGDLLEVFKRSHKILADQPDCLFAEDKLVEPAEWNLHACLSEVNQALDQAMDAKDYAAAYAALARLQQPLHTFFDANEGVRVMAVDRALRENRIALLQRITGCFNRLLDFSEIKA